MRHFLTSFLIIFVIFVGYGYVDCLDNGVGMKPPMGWATWCTDDYVPCFDDYCDEKELFSVAEAMSSNGMLDLGYQYINLDDCWAGPRDNVTHEITANLKRFPSGSLKPLADYVHSKGLKLGLYTDVGTTTCRGDRPGSWPYYTLDAQTYAEWGIDFVKMDWCHHPGGHTAQELYAMMRDALNATQRRMFFSICEWGLNEPWKWGAETGNSWRVGPDHLPLWWTPETSQDPGQGQGTANIISHMVGLGKYGQPGGWNDMDYLMPGFPWMSKIDQMTEFSFWALLNSPLIVATDIRDLSNKEVILNEEVIAVNQMEGGSPDLRSNFSNSEVWSKLLLDYTPPGGKSAKVPKAWAVILYNKNLIWGYEDITFTFDPSQLPEWPNGAVRAQIRDLWTKTDLGVFKSKFTAKGLAPHEVMMLILVPLANR